jgi:hypothetical protein
MRRSHALSLLFVASLACLLSRADAAENAAEPRQGGPASGAKLKTGTFWLDSGACPRPEDGPYDPGALSEYAGALRTALLPEYHAGILTQMIVEPSFAPPYLVAIEGTDHDGRRFRAFQIRTVRARKNLWAVMMKEMERQQGAEIKLDEKHQKRALEGISRATETHTLRIDQAMIPLLLGVSRGVVARTQYVDEILEAAGGTRLAHTSFDGTSYHFWVDGRSAQTQSPGDGTLLADFVEIEKDLAHLVETEPAAREKATAVLREKLVRLKARVAKNEQCLAPSK